MRVCTLHATSGMFFALHDWVKVVITIITIIIIIIIIINV